MSRPNVLNEALAGLKYGRGISYVERSGRHGGMGSGRERVIKCVCLIASENAMQSVHVCTVQASHPFMILTLATPTVCPPCAQICNSTRVRKPTRDAGFAHSVRPPRSCPARTQQTAKADNVD